ncbi:MAG: hypothetical protein QXX95_02635 [Nitrososphaerales archaeon]
MDLFLYTELEYKRFKLSGSLLPREAKKGLVVGEVKENIID